MNSLFLHFMNCFPAINTLINVVLFLYKQSLLSSTSNVYILEVFSVEPKLGRSTYAGIVNIHFN